MKKHIASASLAVCLLAGATATAAASPAPDAGPEARTERTLSAPPSSSVAQEGSIVQKNWDGVSLQDWPPNAFTVGVSLINFDDHTLQVYGEWDWDDNYLLQDDPEDLAALIVNKKCGRWEQYRGKSWSWSGQSTNNLVGLRSGGTGTKGPVWNIYDRVSNHENQTDHGYLIANYDISSCPANVRDSIQAELVFQGIYDGVISSVSASWGGFEVGFEYDPSETQVRSSGAASVGRQSGDFWTD